VRYPVKRARAMQKSSARHHGSHLHIGMITEFEETGCNKLVKFVWAFPLVVAQIRVSWRGRSRSRCFYSLTRVYGAPTAFWHDGQGHNLARIFRLFSVSRRSPEKRGPKMRSEGIHRIHGTSGSLSFLLFTPPRRQQFTGKPLNDPPFFRLIRSRSSAANRMKVSLWAIVSLITCRCFFE